jgi:hypothetical protein
MRRATATRMAIDLMLVPSRARILRAEPLPEDVMLLLQIAAGDREAADRIAELSGKPPETVRAAAGFFIQQILLAPQSDSYRVLGARRTTTPSELRRNMGLLVKWLHAEGDRTFQPSVYMTRVIGAWNDLKTPERRAAYDKARLAREGEGRTGSSDQSSNRSPISLRNGEIRSDKWAKDRMRRSKAIGVKARKRVGLLRRVFSIVLGWG